MMEDSITEPSLYTVKALFILDGDGNRLLAKYYDNSFSNSKEQRTFEQKLFAKTHKANGEVILLDGLTCVYRSNVDLFFYVVGSSQENEIMLTTVLTCLYDSIQRVMGKVFEKRHFLSNLDAAFLVTDEIIDGGVISELDPETVLQRAAIKIEDQPLGEQTVAQVLQSAKEQLKWSLLK